MSPVVTLTLTFAWKALHNDGTVEGGPDMFDMMRLDTPEAMCCGLDFT